MAKNEYAQQAGQAVLRRTTGRLPQPWYGVHLSFGRDHYRPCRPPYSRPKDLQVFPDGSQGKHAVTHYRIIEPLGYVSLIECRLETGRTHQIRVHMAWKGHPLFNDEEYGGHRILKGTTFTKYQQFVRNCFDLLPRQALHARTLSFDHPVTGKRLSFESPVPQDMVVVIEKWRNYIAGRE